jgi:enamine deaminase RidA (YjgF/YER057c/UK114 family)
MGSKRIIIILKEKYMNRSHFLSMVYGIIILSSVQLLGALEELVPTQEELFRTALELPVTEVISPIAQYVTVVQTGNLVVISGQLPRRLDFSIVKGKLGGALSVEQGYYAAHLCALAIIAHLKAKIGDLSRVRRCVKLTGYINATSEFTDHSLVMNGASDVMVQFFGEAGKHARATVGVTSLPLGSAVEVEAIFEIV